MIEYNIEVEELEIERLQEQEKKERLNNNKLRCLEISIKIVNRN